MNKDSRAHEILSTKRYYFVLSSLVLCNMTLKSQLNMGRLRLTAVSERFYNEWLNEWMMGE